MAKHATAESAQAAFYAAFERGDFEGMRRIWCQTPDTLCIHPAGDLLKGSEAILATWRAILADGGAGRISFETLGRSNAGDLVVLTGYEHITPTGSRMAFPPVLATNVYRESGDGWQMVMHHASPIARRRPESGSASSAGTRH